MEKITMITVNGRNWENRRGLTQVVLETMAKVAVKTKKNFNAQIEALERAYYRACPEPNQCITPEVEMELVEKFVHVQKSFKE